MSSVNWTMLRRTLVGDRNPNVLPPNIKLPVLPHAVLEFSRKAEDPNAGPGELGRIVESDSGLTCELLKYVNSSKFGLRTKVGTAQQAITTVGVRTSKLLLLTAGVERAMKSYRSKLVDFQSFWLANLERALMAKEVAGLLKANKEVAFAGSMLHDFLLPLLTNESHDQYQKFLQLDESERPGLADFERSAFGWDHPLATAQVLMSWSFPDELVVCVLLHHGGLALLDHPELGRTAVAAVAVAALIPDALHQSPRGMEQLAQLDAAWPEFRLEELADRVAEQLSEATPLASRHVPLKSRCQQLVSA